MLPQTKLRGTPKCLTWAHDFIRGRGSRLDRLHHEATREIKPLRRIPAMWCEGWRGTHRTSPRIGSIIGCNSSLLPTTTNQHSAASAHYQLLSLPEPGEVILGVMWMRRRGAMLMLVMVIVFSAVHKAQRTSSRENPSQLSRPAEQSEHTALVSFYRCALRWASCTW